MDDPSDQKADARPSASSILARVILGLGRALIGAFAGLVVVTLTLIIASSHFGLITLKEPATSDPFFWFAVGLGVVGFAFVAVISGGMEIKGKAGDVIKGMLAGTTAGVVVGWVFGEMVSKGGSGAALGIFCGGPLGAYIGGTIGAAQSERLPQKPAAKGDIDDDLL
jgi:hypothetical protein